jgi:plasmid stabilization system protein ParE
MRPVRLRYTAQARQHIASIYGYIRDRNPTAARQVVARIRLAAERSTEFPRHATGLPMVATPKADMYWGFRGDDRGRSSYRLGPPPTEHAVKIHRSYLSSDNQYRSHLTAVFKPSFEKYLIAMIIVGWRE